jgi:hypothetical protein
MCHNFRRLSVRKPRNSVTKYFLSYENTLALASRNNAARYNLVKIVNLEVAKVIERVRAKDIRVQLDRSAVEFLIDKGSDPTYGARPMRRAVERYLEDLLAEGFLRGNIKQGDTLAVHAAGEQLAFKVTQSEQSEPANGSPLRSLG